MPINLLSERFPDVDVRTILTKARTRAAVAVRVVLTVGALVASATGCSSSSEDETVNACSTGPLYTPATVFPFEGNGADTYSEHTCKRHCGQEENRGGSGFSTVAALPSGACSGSEVCDLAAEQLCTCPEGIQQRGPVNGYRCRCTDGSWACSLISAGASICSCGPVP
jgi:hypothetical protein